MQGPLGLALGLLGLLLLFFAQRRLEGALMRMPEAARREADARLGWTGRLIYVIGFGILVFVGLRALGHELVGLALAVAIFVGQAILLATQRSRHALRLGAPRPLAKAFVGWAWLQCLGSGLTWAGAALYLTR